MKDPVDFLVRLLELALEETVPPGDRDRTVAQVCAKLHERRARRTSALAFKPEIE